MQAFNLLALDKELNIITPIRAFNVQWNRKYHEPGTFSIQIPINQYDASMTYIYTKERPEVGLIDQVNLVIESDFAFVQISGWFLEQELNRMIVYQKGQSNITNAPDWAFQSGAAEDVATEYFEGFRRIEATMTNGETFSFALDIAAAPSMSRGHESVHYRNGEFLGEKCYEILKPSGMSYRIMLDYYEKTKTFEVWQGKNRTQESAEDNPVLLSTKNGTIIEPNILIDDSTYRNAAISVSEKTNNNDVVEYTIQAYWDGSPDSMRFITTKISENPSDYKTKADFRKMMEEQALNEIEKHPHTLSVNFDTAIGSYIYGEDFDLGDLCSVEIPEVGISTDSRIIGAYEVMKDGTWTLELELGELGG